MLKKLFVAFEILISFCSYAGYDAQEHTLDNGLKVILVKKAPSTVAYFSVWYKCGSIQDFPGKSGVAHFLEHMAFEIDGRKFGQFLENIGAENNAFTSYNKICFYEIFDKKYLDEVAKNEAERMKKIDIDEKNFQAEKGAILEERNWRTDNDPDGASSEESLANIFNRKAGGIGIIGWRHEIQSITKDDIQKYHQAWFVPNNAFIIIVGDLKMEEILPVIEKYFGDIPKKELTINASQVPNSLKKCSITYSSQKVQNASVEFLYNVPKLNFKQKLALKLAVRALNLPSSEVKHAMKFILKKASDCGFYISFDTFSSDFLGVTLNCLSLNDLEDSKRLWKYFKMKIANAGISQNSLDIVKRKFFAEQAYEQDDVSGIGNYFGYKIIEGASIKEILSLQETVQSISLKECNDILCEVFSQKYSAMIENLPKGFDRE